MGSLERTLTNYLLSYLLFIP